MNTRPIVKKGIPLLLALVALGAGNAVAQDKPATDPKPAAGSARTDDASLEARLEAARERLEAAAAEVGELSAQLGETVAHRFAFMNEPRRSIIGVQLDPTSGKDGARVREVSPGGPAAQAGVRAGDVIVAVNGKETKGDSASREVVRLMREVEPDSKVKLRVMRDGKPQEFEVTARAMARRFDFRTAPGFDPPDPPDPPDPAEPAFPAMPFDFMHGWRGGLSGMELATLTPGLGSYFGVDKGVLVLRAPSEDSYKLKDGDVILSIDGREPTSGTHATRILRSYQPGEKLTLRIMRDRKAQNVEVTLPEPQRRERDRRKARRDEREA
jgi:C-terminal processing protease CtpA/Prc